MATMKQFGWPVVYLSGFLLLSFSLNAYFLLSPGLLSSNTGDQSASRSIKVARSSADVSLDQQDQMDVNGEILATLYRLQEMLEATRTEMAELKSASADIESENADPDVEELARRAAKTQRHREQLMLDLPEEERAIVMHQRWTEKNQQSLWNTAEEMRLLEQLYQDWVTNNP